MIAFRIADSRHPIFDPTGAFLFGGRWNSPGKRIIYAAQTYAGALLEVLVYANLGVVPKNHAAVRSISPTTFPAKPSPPRTWRVGPVRPPSASRRFGDQWLEDRRSAVLLVPSVVLQGREVNVLLNPDHPDFPRIRATAPALVTWDPRLFASHR